MIEARSYLKCGATFVPMENVCERIADPNYIDGALVLKIDNVEIVGREMWDLIDQLWAYLVDGLVLVSQGKAFMTYFPDQPIEFSVRPVNKECVLIRVKAGSDDNEILANREEFISVLAAEADRFFSVLVKLVPTKQSLYEGVLRKIRALRIGP